MPPVRSSEEEDSLPAINLFALSVLVLSDEPAFDLGLQAVFAEAPGQFHLEGICRSATDGVVSAHAKQPHIIVFGLGLDPDLARISELREAAPESAIILYGRHFSTELAQQAIELGIRGFLSTTSSPETIRECLRLAATGEMWMERSLATTLLDARPVSLSRRQGQLLGLLVQGLKNREIAASMGISEGTVKAYLTTLFEKIGARDRFELALYGLKNLRTVRDTELGSPRINGLRINELRVNDLRVQDARKGQSRVRAARAGENVA